MFRFYLFKMAEPNVEITSPSPVHPHNTDPLSTLPKELLIEIALWLNPSDQLMLLYTSRFFRAFMHHLKKDHHFNQRMDEKLSRLQTTSLMPLGYLHEYDKTKADTLGIIHFYFSCQNNAVRFAKLFFQSLTHYTFLFQNQSLKHLIVYQKVEGLTGSEWKLTVPISAIALNLRPKNLPEILNTLKENGKPLGARLQKDCIEIYYKENVTAILVKEFLANHLALTEKNLKNLSHQGLQGLEHKIQLSLKNINFTFEETKVKFKSALKLILTQDQYTTISHELERDYLGIKNSGLYKRK